MFAVFGKSLEAEKEKQKKKIGYSTTPEQRFNQSKNVYRISPDYYSISRCYEFIEMAKKYDDIKIFYIAQRQSEISKKTGKKNCRYVRINSV